MFWSQQSNVEETKNNIVAKANEGTQFVICTKVKVPVDSPFDKKRL